MNTIGKYTIIKELGAGGFGAVYLAKDPRLEELVAIKVFHIRDASLAQQATSATSDAGDVLKTRFLNEARTLRKLNRNAHIVDVFEFDELEDGTPYYVMPYLPNSLKDELGSDATDAAVIAELDAEDRPKRLPISKALVYLEQLLIALKAVHKAGLVHRDIKPANLLLDEHGEVKLCDFGIAKVPDSDNSQSGIGMGSRNYMAPEQRQSAKHVDASSDIYSVGVLAYRMITGTLPEGRFADPRDYQAGISDALNDWMLTALAQQKSDRFIDGGVMLQGLREINKTPSSHTEEHTGTWIEEGSTDIKSEFKPLQDRIINLFIEQGEIKPSDFLVLEALADIAGLSKDELAELIDISQQSLAKQDEQFQHFYKWVRVLDSHVEQGDFTTERQAILIEAGLASTSKSKETLSSLLSEKLLQFKSPAETSFPKISMTEKGSNTLTRKLKEPKERNNFSPRTKEQKPRVALWKKLVLITVVIVTFALIYFQSIGTKSNQIDLVKNTPSELATELSPETDLQKSSYAAGGKIGNLVKTQLAELKLSTRLDTADVIKGFLEGLEGRYRYSREKEKELYEQSRDEAFLAQNRKNVAYALGSISSRYLQEQVEGLKKANIQYSFPFLKAGFLQTISGNIKLTSEEMARFSEILSEKIRDYEANITKQNGQIFLAENAKRSSIVKTASGLQYEIIRKGTGPSPDENDLVTVHYKGTLIDGTEFDSSYSRGAPAKFPLDKVIVGWTEGLQYMNEGAKYIFYIPAELAYGERAIGKAKANSTLIFEVELLEFTPEE